MTSPGSEHDPLDLLAESFLARYRSGERPSVGEYVDRHRELAEEIRELFPGLVLLEQAGSLGPPGSGAAAETGSLPAQLGEYRILREVGRGGMGVVYEAVQESLGRHVALKVLPTACAVNPMHLERFRREARAAARLHHTNIVPVFGVGEHQGVHYYAMQFIQGQGLDVVLQELRSLRDGPAGSGGQGPATVPGPPRSLAEGLLSGQAPGTGATGAGGSTDGATTAGASQPQLTAPSALPYFQGVARLGKQAAEALEYAHAQGILHRDIKPSNLLLDAAGTAWLTDFGLAKAEGGDALTGTGDLVGTLRYMAPERFAGGGDVQSDVYSLGVTLYELLTLRPAFADADRGRLIARVTHDDPPRPRRLEPRLPRDLETIVLKAMAREPAARYASAGDLAEDLRRFLADRPIRARRTRWLERTWRWCRHNPVLTFLGVAVGVLLPLLLLGWAAAGLWRGERDAALAEKARADALLGRAQAAEREVAMRSHLARAQAYRASGRAGQRFKALDELAAAATLGPPEELRRELRTEGIACLALTDVRPARGYDSCPRFDNSWERYCLVGPREDLSVRRAADDEEVLHLPASDGTVDRTLFSPDGRFLAVGTLAAGQMRTEVWDLERRQRAWRLPGHVVAFVPGRLKAWTWVSQAEGEMRLYDLTSGKEEKRFAVGPGWRAFALHPNGREMATAGGDRPVQVWDPDTGTVVRTHAASGGQALAWRPDGRFLAVACLDNCLQVWDSQAGRLQAVLRGHESLPNAVVFNRAGDLLASTGWDGTLRLWDPPSGRQLLCQEGGGNRPQFNADDQLLSGIKCGPRFALWEVAAAATYRTPCCPPGGPVCDVTFSPDGRLAASAGEDGVHLWDRTNFREVAFLPVGRSNIVLFDGTGGSLICCCGTALQRWPISADPAARGGLLVGPPESLPVAGDLRYACLARDEQALALADHGRAQVLLLDLRGHAEPVVLGEHRGVNRMAFSPDGRWLATGTWRGHPTLAKVWDVPRRAPEHEFCAADVPDDATVGFSPDGRWLVTGTFQEFRFWHVGSWEPGPRIGREYGHVSGPLVFSGDGTLLALARSGRLMQLWDAARGEELASLPAPDPLSIGAMCFSPDGTQLLAGCSNGRMQVWDLRLIRQELAARGLDWDLPPYPPAAPPAGAGPVHVRVLPDDPAAPPPP
jgi:serine/threonine protein kinase/WD40 repeat protein